MKVEKMKDILALVFGAHIFGGLQTQLCTYTQTTFI